MIIKLRESTFIRTYGVHGYIANQQTKHDRIYDKNGDLFLKSLSKIPKSKEDILSELLSVYVSVKPDTLWDDFLEFARELERDKYITIADTEEEAIKKDLAFSYSAEDQKKSTFTSVQSPPKKSMSTTEFFNTFLRENPRILDLTLEVTSRCNERCIHCYIPHEVKTDDINYTLAEDIIKQFRAMGGINITLTGGELFLHDRVNDIISAARNNDLSITILSNCTYITDKHITLLKDVNINQIQVSIYSMDADEHDEITKLSGSWAKTIKNIKNLISNNIPVQVSCPVMKTNKNSYMDVLKWGYEQKLKVNTDFILMAQTDFNTQNLEYRLNESESEELIHDIIWGDVEYQERLEWEPKSNDLEKYKKEPICGVGIGSICMVANGDYYPCAGWQGYVLGNANKQLLKDIWENSERILYLRSLTNASFPQCIECDARDYCAMCMVRNFNESNGDMLKINEHFCRVAFATKRIAEEYKSNTVSVDV